MLVVSHGPSGVDYSSLGVGGRNVAFARMPCLRSSGNLARLGREQLNPERWTLRGVRVGAQGPVGTTKTGGRSSMTRRHSPIEHP